MHQIPKMRMPPMNRYHRDTALTYYALGLLAGVLLTLGAVATCGPPITNPPTTQNGSTP